MATVMDVLIAARPRSAPLHRPAHNERAELEAGARMHASGQALVPLLLQEAVGVNRLLELPDRVAAVV